MSDTHACPDCGRPNPTEAASCAVCNFPLRASVPDVPAASSQAEEAPAPAILIRPVRPRRPRPASNQALSLWLMFGFIMAATVVYIGVKANVDRARIPVEGSNEAQQKHADALRAALEKDSTNVEARIGLADLLYDTGNWAEAAVHYRAALGRDSSRTSALVDLGVCYYNMSRSDEAERLFEMALTRDPHQPIALFNLGIVNERRKEYDVAFKYFHRALASEPPEEVRQAIFQSMQRVVEATGKSAPPLPDGK